MRQRAKVATIVGLLFCMFTSLAFAELSPLVYQELQQDAQEYYMIQTRNVKTPLRLFSRERPVTVTALIQEVFRSARGVKQGETIEIHYTHYRPPRNWVGPRPIPVLSKHRSYHAFLTWSEPQGHYIPAARGASFDPPIDL